MASTLAITLEDPPLNESEDEITGMIEAAERPESPVTRTTDLPDLEALDEDDDEVYEGQVRLNVQVRSAGMGIVVTFVQQLREKEQFRVSRMANNPQGDVDVWLALREPTSLRHVLNDMEGVAHVSPTRGRDLSPGSDDTPLTVTLQTLDEASLEAGPTCVYCKKPLEPNTTTCPYCQKSQA